MGGKREKGEEGEGGWMRNYLRGDKLRTWPSLSLINPAAEIREPWRKEECWNAPDCLIPM